MLVLLFNEPLSMLFMPDNASNIETVISVMDDLTTMLLSTYFLLGILSVISASLRGLGYSILQMILYVIGLCGSRILWIYLVFPIWKTPVGLMVCYPVSWIVSMILLFVAWLFAHKKLKRQMQAANESVNEP
jgi:Na+-driven multidrug efflux pump